MDEEIAGIVIVAKREEGYRFTVDLGLEKAPRLIVDEDPPLGEGVGPDPSRLLVSAVATCMMSSLIFCMQKSRATISDLTATGRVRFARNEKNRLRIGGIELSIEGFIPENEQSKLDRCLSLFQDFCTVSQSVRSGIPVVVQFNGRQIE